MNKVLEIQTKIETGDIVVPILQATDPKRRNLEAYPTGFRILDEALTKNGRGGFKDGDLIVISGKSGNGKTMLALNLVKNFLDIGILSIIFSYEVIIDNVYETFRDMGVEENPAVFTPKKNVTGDVEWIMNKVNTNSTFLNLSEILKKANAEPEATIVPKFSSSENTSGSILPVELSTAQLIKDWALVHIVYATFPRDFFEKRIIRCNTYKK
jgi:hypothetical protein